MEEPLVSVVVPTFNSAAIIEECLESIKAQTYPRIEVIVVDSFSSDGTDRIAERYGRVFSFGKDPKQKNVFGAPYQRNFGVSQATGELVYIVDSDMRLTPDVVRSGVELVIGGADAVIVPEASYGEGFWARCRALEKECYNRMDRSRTDAARFVRKAVWDALGGLDASLGGGDDWDFQARLDRGGYKTMKMAPAVRHYEGRLTLRKQIRKKFVYGKTALKYFEKHAHDKGGLVAQYSFLRVDFLKNLGVLARQPVCAVGVFILKTVEYSAALAGMICSRLFPEPIRIQGGDREVADRGTP